MTSEFTFVHQNQHVRRVRSRRACQPCRSKKRRCTHHGQDKSRNLLVWRRSTIGDKQYDRGSQCEAEQLECAPELDTYHEIPLPAHSEQGQGQREPPVPAQPQEPASPGVPSSPIPRFIGDLNPAARLLDEPSTPNEEQDTTADEVGLWVQPRRCNECSFSTHTCSPTYSTEGRISERLTPISDLISERTITKLSDLYFANVHPIIPILNEHEYRQSLRTSSAQPALIHVVCLIAAKDHAARPHLRFVQSGTSLVSVREFCSVLHASVISSLDKRAGIRKITLVRLLALFSLHQEGCDGAEQASGYIAQAVHCAQTLALHLSRPRDDDCELRRTFWCLWTLDRLNAAMNSRPCIMSDIDISVEPLTPSQSGTVAFDIWFRIAQMLNHVIGLYRPTNPESITGWDFDYVGFEQIVDELQGWHLSSSTLATLNIFFLATATLAHRLKSIKTLPTPTPARLRQQLSAIQIVRFMKDPARLQSLHPLPIAIYATSLALSVSYQQLRYSRLPSDQEDARQDFNAACSILQSLRVNWPAADAMALLAQKISIELDRIPSLDLLRIDPSHVSDRDARPGRQGIRTRRDSMVENENEAILTEGEPSKDRQESFMNVFDNLETFNLFGGMDDISWMYLDGENPVNFENLLFQDFNAQEL